MKYKCFFFGIPKARKTWTYIVITTLRKTVKIHAASIGTLSRLYWYLAASIGTEV
jgi:hypothetical protein